MAHQAGAYFRFLWHEATRSISMEARNRVIGPWALQENNALQLAISQIILNHFCY